MPFQAKLATLEDLNGQPLSPAPSAPRVSPSGRPRRQPEDTARALWLEKHPLPAISETMEGTAPQPPSVPIKKMARVIRRSAN